MKRYALIGRRLQHSWSQRWFEARFKLLGLDNYSYSLHETENLENLRQWVLNEHIAGFNVTIPFKQTILPLLDQIDNQARSIGAVNCVTIENGHLIGHNTDAPAFAATLKKTPFTPRHALILGTGGAAQAVAHALRKINIQPTFASRNPKNNSHIHYQSLPSLLLPPATIIVNATPVGMHPDTNRSPIDLHSLQTHNRNFSHILVYDLIYNPSPTLLLQQAAALGAHTLDGLPMLQLQAELNCKLWNIPSP